MVDFNYRDYLREEYAHFKREKLGEDGSGRDVFGVRKALDEASPEAVADEQVQRLIDDAQEYDRIARASAKNFGRVRYTEYRRRAFHARQVARYIASNGRVLPDLTPDRPLTLE